MASLETSYLGLELSNPILAGSSGLTGTLTSLKILEEKGVGGVVLKSLFEEQILMEIRQENAKGGVIYGYDDIDDYIAYFERKHRINEYMELISKAKESLSVPVIASVNCVSDAEWVDIASNIEKAGADALQLNIFVPPYGFGAGRPAEDTGSEASRTAGRSGDNAAGSESSARAVEREYVEIIRKVKETVSIPVTAKVGYYFTDIAGMVSSLEGAGADGTVLFNRYFSVDFDVEKMELSAGSYFSSPEEITLPLRWISLLYGETSKSLTAATGIHDGDGVIKTLLAGAETVEVASALYRYSPDRIGEMKSRLAAWMDEKGFSSLEEFRGALSRKKSKVPAEYTRMQYMRRYGDLKA